MHYRTLLPPLPIIAMRPAAADPAADQSARTKPGSAFTMLDANHNSLIDPVESKQMPELAAAFTSADINHDGNLDEPEFNTAVGQIKRQDSRTAPG
jgi:hypothetical protein